MSIKLILILVIAINPDKEIMERKKNRSDAYQQLFAEKAFSHEMLSSFSNEESIYKRLNPFDYDERILELQDQLYVRFWELIDKHLTDRQKEIVNLLKTGATQQECAKLMGVNQSSITKSLNGNVDYSKGSNKKNYGGIILKLNKIIDKDEKVQEILKQISEIRTDNWL